MNTSEIKSQNPYNHLRMRACGKLVIMIVVCVCVILKVRDVYEDQLWWADYYKIYSKSVLHGGEENIKLYDLLNAY